MTNLTWDELPGETATHIADIEQTLTFMSDRLDADDAGYDLADVLVDLENIRNLAIKAIEDMGRIR